MSKKGFQQRLKQLRDRRGMRQYVLADLSDLSGDMIRLYERGEKEPTLSSLENIANVFDVSLDYLVGRTDYPSVVKSDRFKEL